MGHPQAGVEVLEIATGIGLGSGRIRRVEHGRAFPEKLFCALPSRMLRRHIRMRKKDGPVRKKDGPVRENDRPVTKDDWKLARRRRRV
jgi:hypothetical protein